MTLISDAIGARFEKHFMKTFQGFQDYRLYKTVPDFYNPEFNFWVETKAGNSRWGVRPKEEQIECFQKLKEPVVYCIGLHSFDHAEARLSGKTPLGMERILRNQMEFIELYWVTQKVVAKIWERENRLSENGKQRYCMAKKHILQDILLDRSCKRRNVSVSSARDFYGLNSEDFFFSSLEEGQDPRKTRGIVLAHGDSGVLGYLRDQGVLPETQ